jgi:hypothetical protein
LTGYNKAARGTPNNRVWLYRRILVEGNWQILSAYLRYLPESRNKTVVVSKWHQLFRVKVSELP